MRILRVNTVYQRGGAAGKALILHQVLNHLEGWEDLFAYGRGPKTKDPRAIRFALQPEVYLHVALTRLTGLQGYGTWLSTKRLIRLIQEWKPDIIHFHNIHGYYLDLSIAKTVDKLGIPVVWTLHDAWPLSGRCGFFLDCERWKTGCGKCPYLREYPKTYFDSSAWMWPRKRKLLGEVWKPVIVTPSRWLANLVTEACDGRCRVEVIPNGIDTTVFHPVDCLQARKELGLPENQKIVLFAAAKPSERRKGIVYFFEALKYVQADNWMALAVGGTVDLTKWVPQGVKVHQLGYVKGAEEMAKVYSAADLYCVTSLADNFPTTVLESMACKTPVVGFAVGGIPEQVTEECGRLVEPGNAKALGKIITDLLNEDTKRKKMGELCRKRVEQEYNLQLFIKRHLTLYRRLAERTE
ncbi:glycosyl transferase [Archaeoglobales archaeon]|nr:MAG: glycosyl transferase [Archaeoglobales archaeon]